MNLRFNTLPSHDQLALIPLSVGAEFELSEKEVSTLRRHIYAINRDGIRRYRTLRNPPYVMVWRIR